MKKTKDKTFRNVMIVLGCMIAIILAGVGVWLSLRHNNKNKMHVEDIKVTLPNPQETTTNGVDEEKEATDMYNHLIFIGADASTANKMINDYLNGIISKDDLYKITAFHSRQDVYKKFIELANVIGIDYVILETLTPSMNGNVYSSNIGDQQLAAKICYAFNANAQNKYMSDEYRLFQNAIVQFHQGNNEDAYYALQKAIDVAI